LLKSNYQRYQSRFRRPRLEDQYRINKVIVAKELRVVDEEGAFLGIMKTEDALNAAEERGLDLIEIAPSAAPPVAKIISFDKFRYQKEKEEKKKRKNQQIKGLKHIRISPRVAQHDLDLKIKQAEGFLEKGHRIEVSMMLKGREKAHKDLGREKLLSFVSLIKIPFIIPMEPKYSGRGFVVQITKK